MRGKLWNYSAGQDEWERKGSGINNSGLSVMQVVDLTILQNQRKREGKGGRNKR